MSLNKIILTCCLIATSQIARPELQSLQISFVSSPGKQAQSNTDATEQENIQDCVNLLKEISDVQKKRTLTLEEMLSVMQIILYLFDNDTDDRSKRIEILVNGKDKIIIPFSERLLSLLLQNTDTQSPTESV